MEYKTVIDPDVLWVFKDENCECPACKSYCVEIEDVDSYTVQYRCAGECRQLGWVRAEDFVKIFKEFTH